MKRICVFLDQVQVIGPTMPRLPSSLAESLLDATWGWCMEEPTLA